MDRVPFTQWIAWILAAAVGSFTLLSFSYGQFETTVHSSERNEQVMRRLDRLEEKLDRILLLPRR